MYVQHLREISFICAYGEFLGSFIPAHDQQFTCCVRVCLISCMRLCVRVFLMDLCRRVCLWRVWLECVWLIAQVEVGEWHASGQYLSIKTDGLITFCIFAAALCYAMLLVIINLCLSFWSLIQTCPFSCFDLFPISIDNYRIFILYFENAVVEWHGHISWNCPFWCAWG